MAGTKISALTELATGGLASGDWFVVVDTTAGTTKKINADYIGETFTTAFTRTLLDDTTAAAARTTLGLGTGAVMPYEVSGGLTCLVHPSLSRGYIDLWRARWQPIGFNQDWGGPFGGADPTGQGYDKWFPTAYIDGNASTLCGSDAGGAKTWIAQAFKVPETISVSAVWLKLKIVGNCEKDTEALNVYICPDAAGEPDEANPVTNGTMDTFGGPGFAGASMASAANPWEISNGTVQWYRFSDASGSASLTKDTQYYIVVKSNANNAAAYFSFLSKNTVANYYPHGNFWNGDDATPSNWVEDTSQALLFMIEASTGDSLLQSGGQFDGMLEFGEGTPRHESRALCRPLIDVLNPQLFTCRFVTSQLTASKMYFDLGMGTLHKNRVTLAVDGSNHLVLTVYESDGTTHTVTGTTNITTGGTYDIMFSVRAKNDAADFVKLYLNGATEGTAVSAASIAFDPLLPTVGHMILGGGFPANVTWDKDFRTNQFTAGNLPSNDADTAFTTTTAATEGEMFRIVNTDVMFQSKAYSAVGNEDGYFKTTLATLVEATGYSALARFHMSYTTGVATEQGLILKTRGETDGDLVTVAPKTEYIEVADGTLWHRHWMDMKRHMHTVLISAKGDDFYVYVDHKLVVDGTNQHDAAGGAGSGSVDYGDNDTTANSDADVITKELMIYDGGPLFHEVNASQLHEFSMWAGDKTGTADELYNAGTFISTRDACGFTGFFIKPQTKMLEYRTPITSGPTTTSTSAVLLTDMECFVLSGDTISAYFEGSVSDDTLGAIVYFFMYLDGELQPVGNLVESGAAGDYNFNQAHIRESQRLSGLHKVEGRWFVSGGTGTSISSYRSMEVWKD